MRKKTRRSRKIKKIQDIYIPIEIKSRKAPVLAPFIQKIPEILLKNREICMQEPDKKKRTAMMRGMATGMYGQFTINTIANFFTKHRKTVSNWLREREPGEKKFGERKTYESKSSDPELREFIKDEGLKGITSTQIIANKINFGTEPHLKKLKKISHITAHRVLRAELARPLKLRIVFGLKEEHIVKRYKFTNFIKENKITGKQIIFTDEKIFNFSNRPNPQNIRIRFTHEDLKALHAGDEEVRKRLLSVYSKKSNGIMVGGAITFSGEKILIFIIGIEDASVYAQMLTIYKCFYDKLKETNPGTYYFMQDGARSHTEKKNLIYIQENMNTFSWPPHSPDLNPIENMWGIMSSRLSLKDYVSIPELVNSICDIWINIPLSMSQKLCNSFDRRIEGVNDVKGGRYNYKKKEEIIHNWGVQQSSFKDRQFVVFGKDYVIYVKRKHKKLLNLYFAKINSHNKFNISKRKVLSDTLVEKLSKTYLKKNKIILKTLQHAIKISKDEDYLNLLDCYDIDQIIFQNLLPFKYQHLFKVFYLAIEEMKIEERQNEEINKIKRQLIKPNELKPFPTFSSFLVLEYVLLQLSSTLKPLIDNIKENLLKKPKIKPSSKSNSNNKTLLNSSASTIDPLDNEEVLSDIEEAVDDFIPTNKSQSYRDGDFDLTFNQLELSVNGEDDDMSEEDFIQNLNEKKDEIPKKYFSCVKEVLLSSKNTKSENKYVEKRNVKNLNNFEKIVELFDIEDDPDINVSQNDLNQIKIQEFNTKCEQENFINNPLLNENYGNNINPFYVKKDDNFRVEIESSLLGKKKKNK